MIHLDTKNINYGQKRDRKSNCQFDSRPLKVRNRLDLFVCKWRATYHWKAFNEGYNFASNLISIKGLHTKLWASKVMGIPISGTSRLLFGSLRPNDIWVSILWLGIENTIKGKIVASPKSGLWWVLGVHVCPQFVHAPKMFQL
jgi:hypothetical protein